MSVFLFVCPSRYDARHRKPRRSVYALNLGGTGISPPDKRPPPGQKHPGQKSPGPGHPTSGDIFYCSGSRQLNHSSLSHKNVIVHFYLNVMTRLFSYRHAYQARASTYCPRGILTIIYLCPLFVAYCETHGFWYTPGRCETHILIYYLL